MSKNNESIVAELGEWYKDSITGFEGKCIGLFNYLHGCTRVQLAGKKVDSEGNTEPVDYVFDEPQLTTLDNKPVKNSRGNPGGPKDTPSRGLDPTR